MLFGFFLRDSELARDGLFRQSTLDRILRENESGAADHGNRLWLLLNSEVWYWMFVRGDSSEMLSSALQDLSSSGKLPV